MVDDTLGFDDRIFEVKFLALVPTESSGQLVWAGTRDEAIEALENYLLSLYGPKRFKITQVSETDEVGDNIIRLPPIAFQSKEEH